MKKVGLNVPKPCSQDWGGMTPEGRGRFCGSCNKTVVDFTKMENHEIVDYLKNQGGRTCGYFLPHQVSVERPKHHQFLVNLYQNAQNGIKTTLLRNVSLALIAFCMTMVGCNSPRTTGEIEMPSDTLENEVSTKYDTSKSCSDHFVMGDTTVAYEGKKTNIISEGGNILGEPSIDPIIDDSVNNHFDK